jgi:8-oxo-dGTP diphosphatase
MKIKILGSTVRVSGDSISSVKKGVTVKDLGVKAREGDVRHFYGMSLGRIALTGTPSVTFEPIGCKAGFPLLASAKIAAQEVLKHLRSPGEHIKEIVFASGGKDEAAIFDKGVIGYLRHFVEDLSDRPFTTVDAIIETGDGVVVIERSNPPFGFALPGGFVDRGESLEKAVAREAREETGLKIFDIKQFHTYSDPKRDPRFHTIGTVFIAKAKGEPKAGDDAAAARIVKFKDISRMKFAFDHSRILSDYLRHRSGKDPFKK